MRRIGTLCSSDNVWSLVAMIESFRRLLAPLELHLTGKWFMLSALIGILAGLGAIGFQVLTQGVMHFTLGTVAGYLPHEAAGEHSFFSRDLGTLSPWMLMAVITLGGLASGTLVYTFAPEAEGHGTDAAIDAFHNHRGLIRWRIPLVKTFASAITLGTGGSGGREGPIAQIGAGFGSTLATWLKLSARDRRIMMAAGMGAGVGAIFRAPLAGALFAGEIFYRDADLESDVIVPSAISSVVGYTVYCLFLPEDQRFTPLFGEDLDFAFTSFVELIPLAALSVVLVLVGIVFIKSFYGAQEVFKRVPLPRQLRPALGAALTGALALGLYYAADRNDRVLTVLSTGYGALQDALIPQGTVFAEGWTGIGLLMTIALAKIATTSLTISSGGSGGVFGPSMVIGGCTGAAVGQAFHLLWPEMVPHPQTFAIIGMAGFFAGAARAPFSTIIMVSEMTGNYSLLLPTMWVCMLCFLLNRRWTLYVKQVPSRLESSAHRGDFIVDILEGIKVGDVFKPERKLHVINERTSLDEIVHTLARTQQHYFPVMDDNGRMVGIFSSDDVRTYLYNDAIWQLANARDLMVTKVVSVTPDDDLNMALRRFTALNLDELPVLDPTDSGRLLGMLRRKETIAFYNRRLMEHKDAAVE